MFKRAILFHSQLKNRGEYYKLLPYTNGFLCASW